MDFKFSINFQGLFVSSIIIYLNKKTTQSTDGGSFEFNITKKGPYIAVRLFQKQGDDPR